MRNSRKYIHTPCTAAASFDSRAQRLPVPLALSSNHAISCFNIELKAIPRKRSVKISPAIPNV